MKEYIKKVVRSISAIPIIGRPVQIFSALARLPQIRDMVFEMNHNIHDINHRINDINARVDEVSHQLSYHVKEINNQVNEINNQVNEINKRQHAFDTQHLPDLLESLNYQENLKKSLPVVLRKHHRSLKSIDG